jgi:hypothetical protein
MGSWGHYAKGLQMNTACRNPSEGESANMKALSVLVVRNPYERLLSGYLGQVAGHRNHSRDPNAKAHMRLYFPSSIDDTMSHHCVQGNRTKCESRYGDWVPSPQDFARFVQRLTSSPVPFGNSFAYDHLAPITTPLHPRRCLQQGGGNLLRRYHVLKVERQHEWYPSYIEASGLLHYVNSSHWKGGCFWHGDGQTCSESLVAPQPNATIALRRCSKAGGHDTGACTMMKSFYTAETAARVTAYFAKDLETFSYPRWSPTPEQPLPQAGPALEPENSLRGVPCICGTAVDRPFPKGF